MKNKSIIFFIFTIVFCINIFADKGFINKADIYFASEGRSLYDINSQETTKLRNILEGYRDIKGINLDILMRTYPYKLIVVEENEAKEEFLIQFDISEGQLPEFITRNMNFYWDKMYKDTNVAFDLDSDFVFAFDSKILSIAKGINLFFDNELLTYMENPEYLEKSEAYKNMFSDEKFNSVFYDLNRDSASFYFNEKEKIKTKSDMKLVKETIEEEKEKKELVYFEDSNKVLYTLDFESFNMFIDSILPAFGKADFETLAQLEHPYFVSGDAYAYVVFEVTDKEDGMKSIVDAVKNHIFYKDQFLEISDKSEDISYIELPLIYKKIYLMYLNEENTSKIIVSDREDILRDMKDKGLLVNIYEVEEDKKINMDFDKGVKIIEYYENAYNIKEIERM